MTDVLARIAPGAWAWIQGDGSWWIGNAGLVAGDEGDILIDTCATETRTRRFLDQVKAVRPGSPIRFAVNTHLHGDHTHGNSLLPGSTIIVGHSQMRAGLAEDTIIDGCPPFWNPVPDWGGVRKRLPSVTYEDRLVLHSGSTEVHVVHPGCVAHTPGDSVAFVPAAGTLFTGDLLFHGVTPLVFMGSLDGALRSLDRIAEFDADVVVPGHGAVLRREDLDAVLEAHRRYYRLIRTAARAGVAAGIPPLEAARRAELGDFAAFPDAERIVLNLHRAYVEITDGTFDLLAAFEDAVLYHGAPLPTSV
ncbi:MBL fold metallo-hydrolase [Amycolatopsis sp. PS_44_ISF1]|uniref:MBL fold metallo-hydrolase n=1 Tax=Amycolatopsis sp. PS_44_ISF1 TaxID=2974917 RepID=UPI0028DF9623|nr:MBL fold metallo-hydrolase [Amycolatopsis sp. PS_44_ISF1]MDT8914997.1 MBL fold metallo-hydrolase [Amycolatopsis sp. PS_44_ISF1]